MTTKIKTPCSPLRYPGSKSKVIKKIRPYLTIPHKEYREPFVGGASIFLSKPLAENNWINDKDKDISTLWEVIKNYPDELCELVRTATINVEQWIHIKNNTQNLTNIEKAFRCLFLNRTNYSGILLANPIGGISQNSEYRIDCRWNPQTLIKRIKSCSEKLRNTKITNYDYKEVINAKGTDVFMVIDPPYYKKGQQLYPVYMTSKEHEELANILKNTKHKFLLTIDNCPEVLNLYKWAKHILNEQWFYTINSQNGTCGMGKELFITNFQINSLNDLQSIHRTQKV